MKSKWERIKELYKNKYTKPLLFFGFYFIFFAIVILTFSSYDETKKNNVENGNPWDNITNNYEYLYEIDDSVNVITLEGKCYGNKNIFTKKVNDAITNEVYIFYDDIYIKNNDTWESVNDYVLIDKLFDNKYLNINYIKSLLVDAELINSTTNFDESITDTYSSGNINIEVVSSNNELKKISLNLPLYKVVLQYKNINKVKDFVVEK